jgi:hypothetical protein
LPFCLPLLVVWHTFHGAFFGEYDSTLSALGLFHLRKNDFTICETNANLVECLPDENGNLRKWNGKITRQAAAWRLDGVFNAERMESPVG